MQKRQGLKLLSSGAVYSIDSIGIVCVCKKNNHTVEINSNCNKRLRKPEPDKVVVTDIHKDDKKSKMSSPSVKFTIRNLRKSNKENPK